MKVTIGIGWYILPPLLMWALYGFQSALMTLLASIGVTFLLFAVIVIATIWSRRK